MADVKKLLNEVRNGINETRQQLPEVMQKLMDLSGTIFQDGVLSTKQKELIAVAISTHIKCEYCIVTHVYKALEVGATPEEIMEAASVAFALGGGPSMAYTVTLVRESIEVFKEDFNK